MVFSQEELCNHEKEMCFTMSYKTRKFCTVFDLVKLTLVYIGISFYNMLLIPFQVFVAF